MQCIRTVEEQYLVGIFAGRSVRPVGIFFNDHAAGFVLSADDIADHHSAWRIVIAKQNDGLEAFQPIPAMIDPVQIAAAGWNRYDVACACLIQRQRIDHSLGDDLRLREGTQIHAEEDWASAWKLPFLALFALWLSRCAEFDVNQFAVPVKGKEDVPIRRSSNRKGIEGLDADLSGCKVAGYGFRKRQHLHIGKCKLLFYSGGGADQLRPLAKSFHQVFKTSAHSACTPFADIYALSEVQGKGVLIRIVTAVTDGTMFRDQFIAPDGVGFQMPIGKIDDLLRNVHRHSHTVK